MKGIPRLLRWIFLVACFLFIVMVVMRLLIWWYFKPEDLSFPNSLSAFWLGFRYDAREIGILSLLLFLLGSIRPLNPFETKTGRRTSFTLLFIASFSVIVFYVFDFLHFRYLLQRLNASVLSFVADAKISGSMIWQTYPVIRIVFGMLLAMLIFRWVMRKFYKEVKRTPYAGKRGVRIGWGILFFLICALGIFGRVGQYPLRWSDAFDLGSDFKANLALNPFQSFFSSLGFRSSSYDLGKVKKYYPIVASYLEVRKSDSSKLIYGRTKIGTEYDSAKAKPNIVLIICESFSGYKSSMWGNPLQTTPYFNELCKKGLFFDNCFTPSYGTARGVWATVTGIPDVEINKTASRNPSLVDQHTIINDFDGYLKFYFLGGSTSWANIRGLLTNNIKDLKLYEEENFKSPKIDVWGISDKNLFMESNDVLKTQTSPFFAIIQTADNHRPYSIPPEDLKEFKKVTFPLDSLRKFGFDSNDELNAFRFTDYCYQKFIEAAKKERYFSNTIFMFIGDHGIGGNAGSMFPRAWSDNGITQYHVPLLFYAPALIASSRWHCVASQVDVLPTLAGLANISYRNTTLGRDLIHQYQSDSGRSNMAFIFDPNTIDIGVVKGQWYYTHDQQGSREKMWWADFAAVENPGAKDTSVDHYRDYTNAIFETARYMLHNNKKAKD